MDTMWLVLIALALGLIVGGGFVALIILALRRGERAATVVSPVVPDGVDQVLEALDSAGIVVDPSNNVLKASPGAFALGLVRDRTLANPELMELSLEVRRTGEAVTSELELALGRFGEATRHLSVRAAPLGSRFILLLAEDHTEARRLDEVRRDFIANISHELKTPIGAIGLLSEALDTAADDPERVRRFASRLATESQRLTRMTAEIIDLSRLQAADALHQPELVRLDRVIAAAVDQNRVPAEATGVGLSVRGGKGLEVYGDEAMLVVAVHNLISNAIHYSPTGSQVGVGVRALDDVVEVAVTDQGVGIADEDRDRVFERFFRVDQARSRHTGGTGLGLSIVKHTIQNHGGDVKVWSQLGRGSTFTIRLPRATTPPEDLSTGTARSTQ